MLQRQRPDLYVDIPHTYVNVYDGNQVRGKLGSYDRPSHNTATHRYSDRDLTCMWISHTPMSMFMMATRLEVSKEVMIDLVTTQQLIVTATET